jgi:PAS domain S-box-containing protein
VDRTRGHQSELRATLAETLVADRKSFRETVDRLAATRDFDAGRLSTSPETFEPPAAIGSVPDSDRRFVWRAWTLETAPIGIVLTGAAYQDNPLLHANRATRRLTGHSLEELHGENLRRLQGPQTDPTAVAKLHEALRSWSSVTVELCNYRADGTPFTNRVSLIPVPDASGTVEHWFGLQAAVSETEWEAAPSE